MDNHLQTIAELENALSEKQMEIEILNMITPHHLYPKPIDSDRLFMFPIVDTFQVTTSGTA